VSLITRQFSSSRNRTAIYLCVDLCRFRRTGGQLFGQSCQRNYIPVEQKLCTFQDHKNLVCTIDTIAPSTRDLTQYAELNKLVNYALCSCKRATNHCVNLKRSCPRFRPTFHHNFLLREEVHGIRSLAVQVAKEAVFQR